ncbi:flagellar hook-associated protein FlgK [Clostridium tagluense]|uniref:flagellar hook-associated protein FlgK n=1 Tax=Clostridium tagluense TaxID=360422 RepID=UPI001CF5BE6E|nr:flagellar hook-associated protein FlgK [Clostridium tagluense]MCB2297201.1 flagellar hook-associated protein FlgK [Clostridium tagluense]
MSGLFGTFNVATRGMSAQQKALDVVSHNIANANTEGYSRQRATMETTRPFGMPSMNNAMGPGQLGTGVEISAITRIRDGFLDYQVRMENGTSGLYQGREKFLTEIEGIMNEPSDTGVSTLLTKVFNSWQELSLHPESSNSRTVVAQQSKALTDELNNTYNQLTKLKVNSQDVIKQNVVDVNSMLDQLNVLNQQVISVKIGGNEPNDLMDRRDLLVDQLSVKFGITIDKKSLGGEDLKPDEVVGSYNAYLVKSINQDEVSRFSYVSSIKPTGVIVVPPDVETNPPTVQKPGENGKYQVTYYKNGDTSTEKNKATINMNLTPQQYKELDQGRVLWADKDGNAIDSTGAKLESSAEFKNLALFEPQKGELKGYMSVQEDIDKYVDKLNSLARGIAFSINAVHSGESDATTKTGIPNIFVNSTKTGVDGEIEINAGNISINKVILDDVMKIKVAAGDTPSATDGKRALAIASLRDIRLDIQSINNTTTRADFLSKTSSLFSLDPTLGVKTIASSVDGMTVSGYFTDIVNRLAVQTQEAKRIVKNHESLLKGLDESRTSISGVSLDEEMANMIQFQHAYQANAKIISTVDELLDVVINGLKR